MKLKNLFAAAAVAAGLCLTGMSAVQAAPKMPESISITYVKSPFNLQNIVMKERGMLEDAFKAEGVKINWRVINSGAIQGQAMASGDLDFSAVMNTASVLMAAVPATPSVLLPVWVTRRRSLPSSANPARTIPSRISRARRSWDLRARCSISSS